LRFRGGGEWCGGVVIGFMFGCHLERNEKEIYGHMVHKSGKVLSHISTFEIRTFEICHMGLQMIGKVLLVWTRVKNLLESHIRTLAHDQIGKIYWICTPSGN
jgi:hypothetical protein